MVAVETREKQKYVILASKYYLRLFSWIRANLLVIIVGSIGIASGIVGLVCLLTCMLN
jgi:hypothetical protein